MCLCVMQATTKKRCTLNSRVHCEGWVKVWFIVKDAMWAADGPLEHGQKSFQSPKDAIELQT